MTHARAAVVRERDVDASRCSATRSGPTSTGPRRGWATTRRWSSARPAGAGPTRSWWPRSTPARSAWTRSGVGKGDRVGIWAPNCAEWVFVQFATAKLGAILVNINPAYRTHELATC